MFMGGRVSARKRAGWRVCSLQVTPLVLLEAHIYLSFEPSCSLKRKGRPARWRLAWHHFTFSISIFALHFQFARVLSVSRDGASETEYMLKLVVEIARRSLNTRLS